MERRYDAVIFDLFGTLIDNYAGTEAGRRCFTLMTDALGIDLEVFMRGWSEKSVIEQRFTGAVNYQAQLYQVCARQGVTPAPEQLETAWQIRCAHTLAALTPRPGTIKVLMALKRRQYCIGLISDCSLEVPELWPATAFAPYFDDAVFSCVAHVIKPDPRVYQQACQHLAVGPQRCLYIGDGSSHELSGARQVGMEAILLCVPYERELVMQREDPRQWDGPVIEGIEAVLAYLDQPATEGIAG